MLTRHIALARGAQLLLIVAIALVGWMQQVETALDPTYAPISFYARSQHGWMLLAALLLTAAAVLGLSRAYQMIYPQRAGARPLVWLAVAITLAGVLRAQAYFPWEKRPTIEGMLHGVATLAGVVFFAYAAFLIAQETKRRLLLAGVLTFVAVIVFSGTRAGFLLLAGLRPHTMGLEERLAFLIAIAWFFVLFPFFGRYETSLGSGGNQA